MSRPYNTSFDQTRSPINSSSNTPALSPDVNFRTNIHRNKTKKWVAAPKVDYGGGWGDSDEEDDEEDDDPPPIPGQNRSFTAPASGAGLGLHRSNSFDRGDDRESMSPASAVAREQTWGGPSKPAPGPLSVQLPPTPEELERQEREARSRPPMPTHTKTMPNVPIIQLPSARPGSSGSASSPRAASNPHPAVGGSPLVTSPRERVPPPLTNTEREKVPPPLGASGERALPLPKVRAEAVDKPAELAMRPRQGSFDKPMPPLPPLEDRGLATISEKSSIESSPASPPKDHSLPSPESSKWRQDVYSSPSYDDYEDYDDYGSSQLGYFPSAEQKRRSFTTPLPEASPAVEPPPTSKTPPAGGPPRIIRPQDIYRRHQEEMERRSQESSRPSIDAITRQSQDSQRPGTSESARARHATEAITTQPRAEDSNEDTGRTPQPAEPGQLVRADSGGGKGGVPQPLPVIQGSPTHDQRESTYGDDILAGYASETPSQDQAAAFSSSAGPPLSSSAFAHESPAPARNDSNASTGSNGRRLANMVGDAFRDETIETPSSTISRAMTDDISPIMSRKASQKKGYFPPVPENAPPQTSLSPAAAETEFRRRSPSIDYQTDDTKAPAEMAYTRSNDVRSPSVYSNPETVRFSVQESVAGQLTEPKPVSSVNSPTDSEKRSPDGADVELDALLGELERAHTPDPGSRSDADASPQPSRKPSVGALGVPEDPSEQQRKSVGVFSLYDSYWQENADDAPEGPPAIQPKSPLRTSANIEPLRRSSKGPDQMLSPTPPPAAGKMPPPAPIAITPSPEPSPSGPQTPVDNELLDMVATTSQFLHRSGADLPTREAMSLREPNDTLRVKDDERNDTPPVEEVTPKLGPTDATTPNAAEKDELITATTSPIGPDSEGIEVLHGPTAVPRPKKEGGADDGQFAKELVNQFSRPQTLMLKETMPMPSGTQVMPPMPPMPDQKSEHPDVVNFEQESEDELAKKKGAVDINEDRAIGAIPGSLPLEQTVSAATPPPVSHSDTSTRAATEISPVPSPAPRPTDGAQLVQPHAGEGDKSAPTPPEADPSKVIRDTHIIASLPESEDRVAAYNATRAALAKEDTGLDDWVRWQMTDNNGGELLTAEIVQLKGKHAAGGLKKTKSRMGLGSFHIRDRADSHSHHGDTPGASGSGGVTSEVAKEKLGNVGKGVMKAGEKTGARVGGWMKRVGRKKESVGGGAGAGGLGGKSLSVASLASKNGNTNAESGSMNTVASSTPSGGRRRSASSQSYNQFLQQQAQQQQQQKSAKTAVSPPQSSSSAAAPNFPHPLPVNVQSNPPKSSHGRFPSQSTPNGVPSQSQAQPPSTGDSSNYNSGSVSISTQSPPQSRDSDMPRTITRIDSLPRLTLPRLETGSLSSFLQTDFQSSFQIENPNENDEEEALPGYDHDNSIAPPPEKPGFDSAPVSADQTRQTTPATFYRPETAAGPSSAAAPSSSVPSTASPVSSAPTSIAADMAASKPAQPQSEYTSIASSPQSPQSPNQQIPPNTITSSGPQPTSPATSGLANKNGNVNILLALTFPERAASLERDQNTRPRPGTGSTVKSGVAPKAEEKPRPGTPSTHASTKVSENTESLKDKGKGRATDDRDSDSGADSDDELYNLPLQKHTSKTSAAPSSPERTRNARPPLPAADDAITPAPPKLGVGYPSKPGPPTRPLLDPNNTSFRTASPNASVVSAETASSGGKGGFSIFPPRAASPAPPEQPLQQSLQQPQRPKMMGMGSGDSRSAAEALEGGKKSGRRSASGLMKTLGFSRGRSKSPQNGAVAQPPPPRSQPTSQDWVPQVQQMKNDIRTKPPSPLPLQVAGEAAVNGAGPKVDANEAREGMGSKDGKEGKKRSSMLRNSLGMSRSSVDGLPSPGQPPESPGLIKRESFMTKMGARGKGKADKGKEGHKKGFSIDMFGRLASAPPQSKLGKMGQAFSVPSGQPHPPSASQQPPLQPPPPPPQPQPQQAPQPQQHPQPQPPPPPPQQQQQRGQNPSQFPPRKSSLSQPHPPANILAAASAAPPQQAQPNHPQPHAAGAPPAPRPVKPRSNSDLRAKLVKVGQPFSLNSRHGPSVSVSHSQQPQAQPPHPHPPQHQVHGSFSQKLQRIGQPFFAAPAPAGDSDQSAPPPPPPPKDLSEREKQINADRALAAAHAGRMSSDMPRAPPQPQEAVQPRETAQPGDAAQPREAAQPHKPAPTDSAATERVLQQAGQNGFHQGAYYGPSVNGAVSTPPQPKDGPKHPEPKPPAAAAAAAAEEPKKEPKKEGEKREGQTGTTPATGGGGKRRKTREEMEKPAPPDPADMVPSDEKIAVFKENPDSAMPEVVAGPGYAGRPTEDFEEDENGLLKMSATAYPGQAWEPEWYMM